jgi:hypothetical protein
MRASQSGYGGISHMPARENNHESDGAHHDDDLEDDEEEFDPAEYDTLLQLERLESLEEEMTELGVSSLDDIRRRIKELNAQLDMEQSN